MIANYIYIYTFKLTHRITWQITNCTTYFVYYRAVQYFTDAFYGEGSGPVLIDQIFCKDYTKSLSDCQYLFLNECSHARDISVVCDGNYSLWFFF